MRLVTVTPEVSMSDVEFMMKRVGVAEGDIDAAMGDKDWVLSVRPCGNYTVAMITTKEFPTALGVSKRNPVDEDKVVTGARIALRRCLEEAKRLKPSGVTEGVIGLG